MSDLQTSNVAVVKPAPPIQVVKKREPEKSAAPPETATFGPAVVLGGTLTQRVEPVDTDVKTDAPKTATAKTDDATTTAAPPPPETANSNSSIDLHV